MCVFVRSAHTAYFAHEILNGFDCRYGKRIDLSSIRLVGDSWRQAFDKTHPPNVCG